jgi:hypothetical protein
MSDARGQLCADRQLTAHKRQLTTLKQPEQAHVPPEMAPPVLEPRPLVRFSWPPRELSCDTLELLIKPEGRKATSSRTVLVPLLSTQCFQ